MSASSQCISRSPEGRNSAWDRQSRGRRRPGDTLKTRSRWRSDEHQRAGEERSLDQAPKQLFIGGEWRDATGGATLSVEDPSTGETPVRDRRRDARRRPGGDRRGRATPRPSGRRAHPTSARRSSIAPSSRSTSAPTNSPLLMTLEMGKSVAESKARGHLRGRVLPLVLRRGAAHRRLLQELAATAPRACSSCASRSAPATSSPPGTSRPRWAPARSARRSPPAARWWRSQPSRPRSRCWRWRKLLDECGLPARRP